MTTIPKCEYKAVDYQRIVFDARDILDCGHVSDVLAALAKLHTRYNDALARIATLEREAHEKATHAAP